MAFRLRPCLICLSASLVMLVVAYSHAETIRIPSSQDTYVWSGSGGNDNWNNADDGLSLGTSTRVYIQWDLSGIPANAKIEGAYIELFQFAAASSVPTGWRQTATFLEDDDDFTWLNTGGDMPGGEELESLGTFVGISGDIGVKKSGNANDSEIEILQDLYDNNGSFVYFLTATGSGFRLFVDREGTGGSTDQAPQLVIDYTIVPEPSALILGIFGLGAVGFYTRQRWKS